MDDAKVIRYLIVGSILCIWKMKNYCAGLLRRNAYFVDFSLFFLMKNLLWKVSEQLNAGNIFYATLLAYKVVNLWHPPAASSYVN